MSVAVSSSYLDQNQTDSRAFTREHALWLGLFGIAALSRLLHLDAAPLNNSEATAALGGLALAHGQATAITNPLFAAMQALLFTLFGAHDWLARLIPACAGMVFCLSPFVLRKYLGAGRALWLSAFLVLSPTLWFVSRQAEGASLAWALALACFCAWKTNNQILSGALMGLLLACGQDAPTPLLVVIAARLADRMVAIDWRRFGAAMGIALLLGSTGLLFHISGLGDVFNGLAAWWGQLTTPGLFVVGRLLMGLAVYEPLIYLAAVIGVVMLAASGDAALRVHSFRNEAVAFARIMVGMILLLIMQGRQVSNLVPVVIGLAGLASLGAVSISKSVLSHAQLKHEGSLMAASLVLWLFGSLAIRQYASSGETSWLLLLVVAVVFNLALLAFGNVLGDFGIGLRAVAGALGLVLVLHTVAVAVQLTQTHPTNPAEAYAIAPAPEELRILAETIENKSARAYGEPNVMALDVAESAPASLRWALRNRTQMALKAGSSASAAMLTNDTQKPQGATAFVGSAFAVQRSANLGTARCNRSAERLDCSALARWAVFREAGIPKSEFWVFWLRSDVAALASGVR